MHAHLCKSVSTYPSLQVRLYRSIPTGSFTQVHVCKPSLHIHLCKSTSTYPPLHVRLCRAFYAGIAGGLLTGTKCIRITGAGFRKKRSLPEEQVEDGQDRTDCDRPYIEHSIRMEQLLPDLDGLLILSAVLENRDHHHDSTENQKYDPHAIQERQVGEEPLEEE